MIKYFSVKNFFSIKNEIIFEGDLGTNRNKSTPPHNAFVIYGANASGKTNFLKALTFILTFMQKSFFRQEPDQPISIEPFALQQDQPTEFYLKILVNKYLYSYHLILTKENVLFERLERSRNKNPIFERKENKILYLKDFSLKEKEKVQENLQSNVSLISFLSRLRSIKWAQDLTGFLVFSNITLKEKISKRVFEKEIAKLIAKIIKKPEEKSTILDLVKIADTEIKDFYLKNSSKNFIVNLIKDDEKELKFVHEGESKNFELDFKFESSGTKKIFLNALPILEIINKGGVFIWDEISADLHFKIAEYIINLFKNTKGQIFCTTHNPALISSCFNKYTLWFTEKENGITDLYCAADFEELKRENDLDLELLYKIGRFGAVPRTFYPRG